MWKAIIIITIIIRVRIPIHPIHPAEEIQQISGWPLSTVPPAKLGRQSDVSIVIPSSQCLCFPDVGRPGRLASVPTTVDPKTGPAAAAAVERRRRNPLDPWAGL